ncbi:MAG: efflux RND transporter permease subunit, partial [Chlamydiae bacterium]|nr:efflux RND transporter permease subunit [Chlamydiota bacterium]
VVSISLCLAIVFLPLLFMTGVIGKIFHEFAAVMLIAILISAFISMSLTPMLCSRFVPGYHLEKKTRMERVSEHLNATLLKYYEPLLRWLLHHKKWVVVFCFCNLVGSVCLFAFLPKEFLPTDDLGIIQGFLVADSSASPEKMTHIVESVQKICMDHPAMDTMVRISSSPTDNQTMFFLNLKERKKRDSVEQVMRELNYAIREQVVGVKSFMKPYPLINLQIGGSTSGKANYQYILQALDPDILMEHIEAYLAALKKRKELTQVSSDLLPPGPILNVNLLRDQAHSYSHLNATSIEDALMYNYGETYISKMNTPENMYYVILEGEKPFIRDPSSLHNLYVGEDHQVAVDSVIETKMTSGSIQINHLNTMSSVTIAFDVAEGHALSEAIAAVEEEAAKLLPPEIIRGLAGNTAAFKQTFMQLTIFILLAVFVVYIILGILYENFIYPLVPLSALPIAILGGLLTLLVFRERLSIYALIGLIMLIGIVMKNGILVVDFALEEFREKGASPLKAVVAACLVRFRPIIMTTFAAMMGSVPVALGIGGTLSQGRAPLGLVVVGGLLFSQVVTLFVIPAFFLYVCQVQEHFTTKFSLFKKLEEDLD